MENLFQGMPLRIIWGGNAAICLIGAALILGAPTRAPYRELKKYFSGFWILLLSYYVLRLLTEVFNWPLRAGLFPWLLLVIVADLPVVLLLLGCVRIMRRPPKDIDAFVYLIFVAAWASSVVFGHNAFSWKWGQWKWGQIFILDITGWRRATMRSLLKQTESKVKDKDLTPIFFDLPGHKP